MKNKQFLFHMVLILGLSIHAGAVIPDIAIDTSTTVTVAEGYGKVTITSPAADTVVEYYGQGYTFDTYDNSVLNVHDGATFWDDYSVYSFMRDTSTVNLYEGSFVGITSLTSLYVMDSSTLNIFGGDTALTLVAEQFGTINLSAGGSIDTGFALYDNSTMNVHNGSISSPQGGYNELGSTATLNFHGYGFVYDAAGDEFNGGHAGPGKLSGFDLHGNPVVYYGIPDPATHSNIHFIPEPASLLLFLAGVVVFHRKKQY